MAEAMTSPPDLPRDAALFLDFDGTLVAIAPRPDAISVEPALVPAIAGITERLGGALAVVSGRSLADIDRYLSPLKVAAAGNHGAEFRLNGAVEQVAGSVLREGDKITQGLAPFVDAHPGLVLDPKPGGVALHYRGAPDLGDEARRAMRDAVNQYPGWDVLEGKMVIEARRREISKGGAVRRFMAATPYKGRTPVFIGDDVTDEEGIEAARELGGFGIKIGAGASAAAYRLSGPPAVLEYLMRASGGT